MQVNVAQATPTVTAFDESGCTTDGAALAYPQGSGAVSVTGVSNGSDQIPTGSFTYCYADAALVATARPAAAPTHAGAYTVLVTFTSSDANYTAAVGTATLHDRPGPRIHDPRRSTRRKRTGGRVADADGDLQRLRQR